MKEPVCDRFEREGLARWDAGLPPDDHERGCADCQQARSLYARLGEGMRRLPELSPPAGWEDRVLARIDAAAQEGEQTAPTRQGGRPGAGRWVWALAACLALAVVLIVIVRSQRLEPVALRQEVLPAASGQRADSVAVGDRLSLRASTGGRRFAELRVYRGEREVVLRCPGDPRCRVEGALVEAELTLESRGSYRAVLLAADSPLPEPKGSLDQDAAAAQAMGGKAEVGMAVDAR